MSDPGSKPAPIGASRDAVIAKLCEHFAADRLEADELERRIDRAHSATTVAELKALLVGLPTTTPASARVAPEASTEANQLVIAIMGGVERKGPWTPARQVNVVTVMGGAGLDFREAILPRGTTEVRVVAIMGGVEIIVPPGLHVTGDGVGIMGGFAHSGEGAQPDHDPGSPKLRIRGLALMGGVEITVREPGETAGDARYRRRTESRKRRRELRSGSRRGDAS